MEDLGYFNEREAECFEREDTLSLSELEKLNIREDIPEIERAEQLLKTGLDKQKISVLSSLPRILASNNSKSNLTLVLDCMKSLWQKHESEANSESVILVELFKGLASLATSTVDGKVIHFPVVSFHDEYTQELEMCREEMHNAMFLLSDEQVTKLLIPLALEFVNETHRKDYAEVASLSIIAALPRLGGCLKKTQIIRVAIEKGDVSQPPGSRLICCLLLGAVTALKLLPTPDIEGLYFQKMMALCQDTDAEVRKCMCIQLDALARAVGEDKASSELLPELLELLQDEEEQVKQNAFLALLSLLDFFPLVERSKRIVPELLKIAESQPDYIVPVFAEQFGNLAIKLATLNHLGTDNGPVLLQSYAKLCSDDDFQLRQFCAYNFPAVVKAFGASYIPSLMDDLMNKLCNDPVEKVRVHIAAGFHEVATLLGHQRALRYLKPLLLQLIKDESPKVQGMMLSRVPQLMRLLFCTMDDDQKDVLLDAVLKAIIQYHSILPASRTRDQLVFIETLQSFPTWFSSIQMYEMVIPILFDLVEDGARPVQLLAMQALLKCIRRNDISSHRYSLLSKLRNEYGHSKSYWRRILYLDGCAFALELNSRQYCRQNFLDIAVDLLEDPVPNVRLKAVSMVPQWRNVLTCLSDDKMLDRIRLFLDESTIIDSDRDVANATLDVRQVIDAADISQQRRSQEDADDRKKMSEEENLGMVSDHEDSSADSKWSSMLEYTLVVGKDGQVVRRARVKSLDLVNKLVRAQGKDTGRGLPSSNVGNGGNSLGGSGITMTSNIGMGNSSMSSLSMGTNGKSDLSRAKIAPKTPTKPIGTMTTLPNCPTARPSNKMAQSIKIMGSSGKLTTGISNKTANGAIRSGTGLPKDAGITTKIPIIRPSAPAKRENSPSTGTKPGSTTTLTSSSMGNVNSSNTTPMNSSNTSGVATSSKSKLGTVDSSANSGGYTKPKASTVMVPKR